MSKEEIEKIFNEEYDWLSDRNIESTVNYKYYQRLMTEKRFTKVVSKLIENKYTDQLEEEKKALIEEKESMRDSMAEIITMILKLPMLDHVGHLQEEIKRALKK